MRILGHFLVRRWRFFIAVDGGGGWMRKAIVGDSFLIFYYLEGSCGGVCGEAGGGDRVIKSFERDSEVAEARACRGIMCFRSKKMVVFASHCWS